MNIKIAKTLLTLSIIYIVGFYVIKFIFPDFLLLQITDQNILSLGRFIESNEIFLRIYYCLSTFLTFYLFVCASRGNFKLNWKELIYLVGDFADTHPYGIYLVRMNGHISTVWGGNVVDIWDCRNSHITNAWKIL